MKNIIAASLCLLWLLPATVWAAPNKSWILEDTREEQFMGNGSQFIYFDTNNDMTPSQAMRLARDGKFETVQEKDTLSRLYRHNHLDVFQYRRFPNGPR